MRPSTIPVLIFALAPVLHAQQTVCYLFKNLPAADGTVVTVTGEFLQTESFAALGASDCDNEYQTNIGGNGAALFLNWPRALRLQPSRAYSLADPSPLEQAIKKAAQLRFEDKRVNFTARVTGRLRVGRIGDLPAQLTYDSVDDISVEELSRPSEIPVIPICELFQNLANYKGRRIAVRGKNVSTEEGHWLSGNCLGAFTTSGYRWPVALSSGIRAYSTGSTSSLTRVRYPTVPPVGEAAFRGIKHMETATWIGRLRMRDRYAVVCRSATDWVTFGFGHLGYTAAELILEEVADVEWSAPTDNPPTTDRQPCPARQ